MRGTFRILKVKFREGVSAETQKPYAILSAKCTEEAQEGEPVFEDIVDVTFAKEDNVFAKHLEGTVVDIDLTSVKNGYRGVGFEFRGRIVRETTATTAQHSSTAAAA